MNFFEELKRRNVFRVGFACTNTISMVACGRKQPFKTAGFSLIECPVSVKADVQIVVAKFCDLIDRFKDQPGFGGHF